LIFDGTGEKCGLASESAVRRTHLSMTVPFNFEFPSYPVRTLLSGTDGRRLTAAQAEGNPNHSSSRKGHYNQDLGSVVVLR
jgi:hypothetical protein